MDSAPDLNQVPTERSNKILIAIACVTVVFAVGIGFFFGQESTSPVKTATSADVPGHAANEYVFPEENIVNVSSADPIPANWVKKEYPAWGFSIALPPKWQEGDLGPMVAGVRFSNPDDTNETISFAYDYPGFASTTQTMEERAHEQLFDVFPVYIAGEKGYRGVFSNATLWLAELKMYVARDRTTYEITLPSTPSDTTRGILSTFAFTK